MYQKNGLYYYSPSDLTRYMESPFASWMDRYVVENPDQSPAKDTEDLLTGLLQKQGFDHEDAQELEFIRQGLSLVKITGETAKEKCERTLVAMSDGADVIVQARLEDEPFAGYADFLVKVPGSSNLGRYHYEVWDTKLSKKIKPTFVIQLCCYVEMLQSVQGRLSEHITVALGNGEKEILQTNDFFYYYQSLKRSFLHDQDQFDSEKIPDLADSKHWADWSDHAEQILKEQDHLLQVATITRSQIKKLNAAGIHTMTQLANSAEVPVRDVNPVIFNRLKNQATIQIASHDRDIPLFKIIIPSIDERTGLALLPPPSPLDVFFDIEGYPLDEGGLEYLWGNAYFDQHGERQFKDFWAHDREQEKQTFEAFIHWVYDRWQQNTSMHIYHYASYEITACRKLMGRYGVCEHEVDQLLRNEVFVDLYKVVKGCLLLGEPRYSIKNVEHLYRGKRETEVGSGGDSVVVYEHWREQYANGEEGDTWQTSRTLKDIRDYNIDDCNSTQELVDWLRKQQMSNHITYLGKKDVVEPEIKDEISERIQLRDRLLELSREEAKHDLDKASLTENLAWMLEFHRREAKPVFWRLFENLNLSHAELQDQPDCIAYCERTNTDAFRPTLRARNLAYEYQFDPAQEFKSGRSDYYILGEKYVDGSYVKARCVHYESNHEFGLIVLQSRQEPPEMISLVPDEYVNPAPIPQAIAQVVAAYESEELGRCAITDYLTRSKPNISGHDGGAIASSRDPVIKLQQVIHAAKGLDHSYLTIQGPPGAGKSYTGKHIIAALIKDGAKVGISSNSHKAINNLLLSAAEYCNQEGIKGYFACTKETETALAEQGVEVLKNNALAMRIQKASVIGATAWGFAREDMTDQLDYLLIDEAGQVSVANLVAMSKSANNLILLGDQMQLGQPSQGTHPAESGLSILDYLLHDKPTISDEMGVFLGTTYRMHSAVNQFISEHFYAKKLGAHPDNDLRVVRVPDDYQGVLNKEAGIIFVPVAHEGNTQASDEEVAVIQNLAQELIGRDFVEIDGSTHPVGWSDMLFIAPYNHQVSKLEKALANSAKVGSVDKFQGQEAPIVFLSMCASDAEGSPRGMDFLFDKHRINVAVSRAQCLVIVVGSPMLGKTNARRVDQLKLINLFHALCAQ